MHAAFAQPLAKDHTPQFTSPTKVVLRPTGNFCNKFSVGFSCVTQRVTGLEMFIILSWERNLMCRATPEFCRVIFPNPGRHMHSTATKQTQQPVLQVLASLHLITKSSSCPAVEEVQDYAGGQTPSFC